MQGRYQIDVKTLGGANTQGRTGYISQASTTSQASNITAGGNLGLIATGDASLSGANVSAGNNALIQGANVSIAAAVDSQRADIQTVQKGAYDRGAASTQTVTGGQINAGNNLTVSATTGNLTLAGASVAAAAGQTSLIAQGDVRIGALDTQSSTVNESYYQHSGGLANVYTSSEQRQNDHASQQTSLQGSSVSGNTVLVQAGPNGQQDKAKQTGDILLSASSITAQGAATLNAGRDVLVDAGQQASSRSDREDSTKSFAIGPKVLERAVQQVSQDLLRLDPIANKYLPPPSSSGTGSELDKATQTSTRRVGSSISADTLSIDAGRDALVRGSAIVTTGDLNVNAARNLDILASNDTRSGNQSHTEANKGLFNTGASLTTGTRELVQKGSNTSSTATSSQVASLSGNVDLKAGESYRQTGSQVLALGQNSAQSGTGGDIAIDAKHVDIDAARNTASDQQSTHFKQEGVTVSLSVPLISALHSLAQTADAGSKTQDSRMQALAAATVAMTVASTVADIAKNGLSAGISVDLGHSQSQSKSSQTSDLAQGSAVSAARDLRIVASGAGKDSAITVTGSDIGAGRNATVKADGAITLQAATSTETLQSSNSSQSASVGVTFGGGSQNGLSIHAAASAARGQATGADQTAINSHLAAGNTVSLQSGGDTTLNGASVQANTVKADIGGNLQIASLQDKGKYDASQQSASVGVSLCIPPICYGASSASASASMSNAKVNGDFLSVAEQSGIKAGDGGFQVTVKGNTDLKGGVITSSQSAIDQNKNSLTTATLTTSELQNKDKFDAIGLSLSGSVSGTVGEQCSATARQNMSEADKKAADAAAKNAGPSYGAGMGSEKGSQGSTTTSGISAGAISITDDAAQKALSGKEAAATLAGLNTQITTETDVSGGISKGWDGQQLLEKVQAQTVVTSQAMPALVNAFGSYADKQSADARADAEAARSRGDMKAAAQYAAQATAWSEGGAYRIAGHAALGALGGGLQGALGAGASAAAVPVIADTVSQLGLPDPVSKALIAVGTTAVSAAAGGGVGAAAGFNQVTNNFLKHAQAKEMNAAFDKCAAQAGGCTTQESDAIFKEYRDKSNDNIAQVQACKFIGDSACVSRLTADAALPGEVTNRQLSSQQESVLYGRQANVVGLQSVTGSKVPGNTDAQQAQQVAQFRLSRCDDPSSSACDALVLNSIGRGQLAALTLIGGTLAGAPVLGAAVAGAPAAGAAVVTGLRACASNLLACANTAGVIAVDAASAEALGGASLSGGLLAVGAASKLVGAADQAAADVGVAKNVASEGAYKTAASKAPEVVAHYGPMAQGPLPSSIANTFRSGTYAEVVTQEPTTLYRVYGGTAGEIGAYWTRTPPAGPVQSIVDSALNPQWGNTAINVTKIEIPAGTRFFEGAAAQQGGLVGGGSQVLFPKDFKIDPTWVKRP